LPPGLSINSTTGVISGTPTTSGQYTATVAATNSVATSSTSVLWTVTGTGSGSLTVQYVKLEALSEINGNPWSAIAEFNLLDGSGAVIPRTGWIVSADSWETQTTDNSPPRAIDGSANTYWHTQWYAASPPQPHWYMVNLGSARTISGFKYLPPPAIDPNGTIAAWRFHTSPDGVNWTQVAQGTFASNATEKTVTLSAPATNQAPTLAAVSNQSTTVGQSVSLALSGSDPDGDTLSYSASGLPPGLGVNASSGLISGSPTTAGTYNVTAQVSDGRGGVASQAFVWTITAAANQAPTLAAVANQTTTVGQSVSLALSASDPDGDALSYSASGLPPGLAINASSGLISGSPTTADTYNVTVQVSDGRGGVASQAFVWTINIAPASVNQAPTLAEVANQTTVAGQRVSLTLSASDPDGDALTYSASGLPPGLSINTTSGLIKGASKKVGTYQVTVGVSDGRGGTASRSFVWTIIAK